MKIRIISLLALLMLSPKARADEAEVTFSGVIPSEMPAPQIQIIVCPSEACDEQVRRYFDDLPNNEKTIVEIRTIVPQ